MARDALLLELGGADAELRLAPGLDLRNLNVDALEGFVISRIGAGATVRTACLLSNLPEEQTLELLVALARRGVLVPGEASRARREPSRAPATRRPDGVQVPLWLRQQQAAAGPRPSPAPGSERARPSRPPVSASPAAAPSPSRANSNGDGGTVAERLAQRRGRTGTSAPPEPPSPSRERSSVLRVRGPEGAVQTVRSKSVQETPSPQSRVEVAGGDPRQAQERAGAPARPGSPSAAPPPRPSGSSPSAVPRPSTAPRPSAAPRPSSAPAGPPPRSAPAGNGAGRSPQERNEPAARPSPHQEAPRAPEEKRTSSIPDDPYATRDPRSLNTPAPATLEQIAAEAFDVDPAILAEPGDIPQEVRRLVLYLYSRYQEFDYYRLLAVPRGASDKEIRKAFLVRTKTFHPDRYFRKQVGSFGAMLHDLYKAVSQAYDVLSDAQKRSLYDMTLRQSEEAGGRPGLVSRNLHAETLYEEGKRLAAAGDFDAAEVALRQAVELQPREETYQVLLHRLASLAKRAVADRAYQRALPALRGRRWGDAVPALRESLALEPVPEVLLLLVRCILRSGGDLQEAKAAAQQALDLAKDPLDAALALSEIEQAQGNLAAARNALQPHVGRASEHPGLRQRLAELGIKR